ncbi:flagellar hook-associated family protein [Nitratireductor basaltis]|uniref:Flagellin n=1 Tax=Nitratireductor basaltis TaxID=472175 RepID=A0A084U888_9HYPH|nr:flagellar hook-associated family protein [Nitratireductor basaltis]KFB09174.1 Flagellar hook-associated protein 3 (HAP3) flgL [Nitratireductor basaltis]
MKTSFVSSSAISQTMRNHMMRMQVELVQRQQEVTTQRLADPGATLGARAGFSFSMTRDIQRLENLLDSNGLAANRLSATQNALEQFSNVSQDLLSTLTAAVSGVSDTSIVRAAATRSLESVTSILNTNMNGEYLFAGINTDVKPVNEFTAPGSPNQAQFDTYFQTHFGFPQSDPAAASITAAQMNDFIDNTLLPGFLGTDWQAAWSNASNETITSRITLNETAQTSTTANSIGMRKVALATAMTSDLLKIPLSEETQKALYTKATALVGEAVADVARVQSEVGVAEIRVKDATDRVEAQIDLSKLFVNEMEGVDPYEASTKLNELLTQIETSYALTARIQQLSLLRHL